MDYLVRDKQGHWALIPIASLLWTLDKLERYASRIMIHQTGCVLLDQYPGAAWPVTAPRATRIKGYVKHPGYTRTVSPRVYVIGYKTEEGFSVPDAKTVDALYVRTEHELTPIGVE